MQHTVYPSYTFHDVVVGNGAMPLQILEGLLDNYIAETLASDWLCCNRSTAH
jgi:hypothetical protein